MGSFIGLLIAFLLFTSLPYIVVITGIFNYYSEYLSTKFSPDPTIEIYDFIIGDPHYLNTIPGIAQELLGRPEVDWMHKTVPQNKTGACLGSTDSVSYWPRGKVLGGTSMLNYMLYVRSHPLDYDNWANLTQDSSWTYENLLPYFKKSIVYKGKFKDNKKHYEGGPYGQMQVEERKWAPFYSDFVEAGKELGFEEIDVNGPQRTGFGITEVSQKEGKRGGTYFSFLKPILGRKNLVISKYSQAYKVSFNLINRYDFRKRKQLYILNIDGVFGGIASKNITFVTAALALGKHNFLQRVPPVPPIKLDKNGRAVGVWFEQFGVKKFARAKREIIVSAGAVDSPKLLMLSGIGPKKHLQNIGIKPRVDLPVGQNLQDHLIVLFHGFLIDKPVSFIPFRDIDMKFWTDYFIKGYGPLTSPSLIQGQAFFSTTEVKRSGVDWPDMQLYIMGAGVFKEAAEQFSRSFNLNFEEFYEFISPFDGNDSFILAPTLVRPKSVGQITLKDKNPETPPIIDPNYLADPQDMKALVESVKFAVKLAEETTSFQKLNSRISPKPYPSCEQFEFKSTKYYECYIRHMSLTLFHPTGTCRMGQIKDPRSVVDPQLRVLKTKGLRVADASIMPVIVNGNTNAPCIMIGEKAADVIREYWQNQIEVCDKIDHYLRQNDSKKCYYFNNKMF